MIDYELQRRMPRLAAMSHMTICVLSVFPDEVLDLLELPIATRTAIIKARTDDDAYGLAVTWFLMNVSNNDLTDQDRIVCGQACAVASGKILTGKFVDKLSFDMANILQRPAIINDLVNWIGTSSNEAVKREGEALEEEALRLAEYVEKYNRLVEDKSRTFWKSRTAGEAEEATAGMSPMMQVINAILPGDWGDGQ